MKQRRIKPIDGQPQDNATSSMARTHRHTILLNDLEQNALERYCAKYHVTNKAKLIREMVMRTILTQFEEDHPTLF